MQCDEVQWSGHAIRRMFERALSHADVLAVLRSGERIADYPDDTPYPSCLLLGYVGARPVHLVVAVDANRSLCYVVTAYEPDPARWEPGFKVGRSS
jgi:hypothetical protein